ncbi:MAG TPA: pyruvate kinase [bacterium]
MKTRIIATVGPACSRADTLRRMVGEGVSVFRFNFSHGTLAAHEAALRHVRKLRRDGRRVPVLQDLAGHRIRIGRLARPGGLPLRQGQRLALLKGSRPGTRSGVSLDYPGPFERIKPGTMIYIDDGRIHLEVLRSRPERLETLVVFEGRLGERKGVNIPDAHLSFPALSGKDANDLEFAVRHQIEYVALSFVRGPEDLAVVRRRLGDRHPACRLIAKIESREGVRNFAGILDAADAVMVARGDLGIALPVHELPLLQKSMIARCRLAGKPVITATQMLEQMTEHRVPTRAEVSDVANAVIDGTDFVMLSGETAAGRFPVETVRMMRRIIDYTERHWPGVRATQRRALA